MPSLVTLSADLHSLIWRNANVQEIARIRQVSEALKLDAFSTQNADAHIEGMHQDA